MGRIRVKHRREGAKRPRADVLHLPDPEVVCGEPARGSVGDSVRMRPRTAHHIGPSAGSVVLNLSFLTLPSLYKGSKQEFSHFRFEPGCKTGRKHTRFEPCSKRRFKTENGEPSLKQTRFKCIGNVRVKYICRNIVSI